MAVSTTILRYQFDDAAGNKVRQGVDSIGKATDSLSARMNRLRIEASHTAHELAELDVKMRGLDGKELEDAVRRGARLEEQLHQINEELDRTEKQRQISLEGPAGLSRGQRLQQLGRDLRTQLPAVPVGSFSTEQGARVVEVFGRVSESFGQLTGSAKLATTAAAGLAAGLAVVAIGYNSLNETFARQTRAIINTQEEATRLRLQGSREEIDAAIEQKRLEDEVTRARIEENKRLLAALESQAGPVQAALADVLNVGGVQELRKATQQLEQSLADNALATDRLNNVLGDSQVRARLMAEAEAELAKARQAATDELLKAEVQTRTSFSSFAGGTAEAARNRLNQIAAEQKAIQDVKDKGQASAEAVAEFNKRFGELGAEARLILSLLPGLEEIERRQQADEDRKEAEADLLALSQKAIDIEAQGRKRIEQIITSGQEKIAAGEKRLSEARQNLIDFDTEQQAKRGEIDRSFMRDDLERLDKYIRDKKRRQRDADKEEIRALEDHRANLLRAEQQNDIAAFLAEQERFKVESRRRKEDVRTSAQDRAEDFELEREAARRNRDERIAALDEETEKRRQALQTEIAERAAALETVKAQIQDQVLAEKAATEQALRDLVSSFDTSTDQMTQTITQGFRVMEQAGINTFSGIIADLQRRANAFYSNQSYQQQQLSGASGGSLVSLTGANNITSFARGAYRVDRPTPAVIGDAGAGRAEAVIPYNTSIGLVGELRRLGLSGAKPSISMDGMFRGARIGGDVAQATLDALEDRVYEATARALHHAHRGGEPNS